MKPIAAAVGAALISGAVMYGLGATAGRADAFGSGSALVDMEDGRSGGFALQPAAPPSPALTAGTSTAPAAVPVVHHTPQAAPPAPRVARKTAPERSWAKTALVIGGSAATGAAVGGILDGRKGALIGAAVGGGAASIYEATRRR